MRKLVAAALAILLPAAGLAEEYATFRDAELMVRQAALFLKKEGKRKAFAAFNDPRGPFAYRDLYVTVLDLGGRCLAHGAKRELIGKSLIAEKDVDGKELVKERIQMAKDQGRGWQEYKEQDPVTGQPEPKLAYFKRVGDVVVACGAYKTKR
jgi:signal transduction histidine kinase